MIALSSEDKVSVIKAYIARLNFDFKLQLNLMIYAFSTRSQLNRSEINNLLGTNLKKSTMSQRIASLKKWALKDKALAKALIEINNL